MSAKIWLKKPTNSNCW